MKRMNGIFGIAIAALVSVSMATPTQAAPIEVDTMLQLLVDVSGSVSASEFTLQRQGYVDAFDNVAIQNKIVGGVKGKIAVQLIYWSSAGSQSIGVDWTVVDSAASSGDLADAILAAGRTSFGFTAPQSAIKVGAHEFAGAQDENGVDIDSDRWVIDVSGDGSRNDGLGTAAGRDHALGAHGVDTINGIVIGGDAGVFSYYQNNVVGGTNSFLLSAASFGDFSGAVNKKIFAEVDGSNVVPEPGTYALFGLVAAGYAVIRRRRRNAS